MTGIRHQLSLIVRFRDHFTGQPVPQELPVRLAGSLLRPVRRPDGKGIRQADGSYRFLGAGTGAQTILWRRPLTRAEAGWVRWDADDPQVTLPLPDPATVVEVDLWPAADAIATAGQTGIRGKLQGSDTAGLEIRIAQQGQPFDRMTRTDQGGEFLFLPPGAMAPDMAGRIPLTIEARIPGGAARPVASGRFIPDSAGAAFAGQDFTIAPQSVARVVFQLT
ncbi:hypothetical protein JJJ17_11235 [Paracoccus caeni]|uniref:Uncharacterized protein n=1 Tax=Paracoccus caeni TaxID=657651 RepID=A0A934SCS8_9RHOB|nr:hypothetical protein [Paracoccus caeni]MBK4216500.1 hypothetical protein [Paracoccus caeni]